MKKAFYIYGAIICLLFGYATHIGWGMADSVKNGHWGPHGHTAYHK